jgi:hypothetical protein
VKGQYGEPWREPAGSMYEIASGMACVLTIAPYPDATAKRRRIIACVNAMDGIDDPAAFVEASTAMLDALEEAMEFLRNGTPVQPGAIVQASIFNAIRKAKAAIAKTEGGAS